MNPSATSAVDTNIKNHAKRLYEVNWWLRTVPQGYLQGTDYGIDLNAPDNPILHSDDDLREVTIDQLAHLAYVEWITLDTVSGLIPICPEREQKICLSTQVLDEARHIEIYEHRLCEFGVSTEDKAQVIESRVNRNLKEFRSLTCDLVERKDYVATLFCQHIVLEGIAFTVFEQTRKPGRSLDPRSSRLIDYVMIDESRHLGFGEHQIKQLLPRCMDRKADLERLGAETMNMVAAYFWEWTVNQWRTIQKIRDYPAIAADFQKNGYDLTLDPREAADSIAARLKQDLKTRMNRIGLDYNPN